MKLEIRPVDKVNVTLDGMNLVGDGDISVNGIAVEPKLIYDSKNQSR